MKITSIFLLMFLLSSMGFAAKNQTLLVRDNQKTFEVILPANPTTGYEWSIKKVNKQLLHLEKVYFEKSSTLLIGAGGKTHFQFKIISKKYLPASTTIIFKYARSWEKEGATLKSVMVNFIKNNKK